MRVTRRPTIAAKPGIGSSKFRTQLVLFLPLIPALAIAIEGAARADETRGQDGGRRAEGGGQRAEDGRRRAEDGGRTVGVSSSSPALELRLKPIIAAHKGKVAVAVKHLKTGERYGYHDTEVMPTASLIKFPVMIEAYRQAAAKKVDLGCTVVLKEQDKVPGSGILTSHFTAGARFTLRDSVRLMIAFSDNTATNIVLDAVGIGSTAATMEAMGYPNTKIHSKVFRRDTTIFPERSKQFGLGSTNAAEMVRLCEAVYRKEVVSAKACEEMLAHLRACEDRDKFPRLMPPEVKIAFKTGSLAETRTAAGILEWPAGPVALCVLSSENEDKRWVPDNAGNRLCAEIARAVFEHFNALGGRDDVKKTAADARP